MPADAPPALTVERIASRLTPFGVHLAEAQLAAIQKYILMLLIWNQKVSLTSIEDPLEIVSRHFGESIFAGKMLFSGSCRLADVGSGAGFPAIPLKIAFPKLEVVLIEPNLKKCAFLTELIMSLALHNVRVFRGQYSAFPGEDRDEHAKFDAICSRALGDYKNLLKWAKRSIKSDGRVILWLGDEDAIILGRSKGWAWDPPTRIPESRRRVVAIGHPVIEADDAVPKRS